ncbi:MAG: DUF6114 domain-containing protein [Thermoprotei archaeon]
MGDKLDKPQAAFVLSIIGGIFILFGGLYVTLIGVVTTIFAGGIGGVVGLVGVIFGVIIIVSSILLFSNPDKHTVLGEVILVFSFGSWIGSLGGFVVGFILGVIGGILALVWEPTNIEAKGRICLKCGGTVPENAKFCPICGSEL